MGPGLCDSSSVTFWYRQREVRGSTGQGRGTEGLKGGEPPGDTVVTGGHGHLLLHRLGMSRSELGQRAAQPGG